MVQLPLETSKQRGKQCRLGMAQQLPRTSTSRGTGGSVGRGPLVPTFFFFLIRWLKKKKSLCSEIGVETQVEVKTQGVNGQVGRTGLEQPRQVPSPGFPSEPGDTVSMVQGSFFSWSWMGFSVTGCQPLALWRFLPSDLPVSKGKPTSGPNTRLRLKPSRAEQSHCLPPQPPQPPLPPCVGTSFMGGREKVPSRKTQSLTF